MVEPIILRRNGETAFAISPDDADQGLRFGIPHRISSRATAKLVAGGASFAGWAKRSVPTIQVDRG
jgi:hypothetical protein